MCIESVKYLYYTDKCHPQTEVRDILVEFLVHSSSFHTSIIYRNACDHYTH